MANIWLWVKKGYLKNPVGKRKNRPKPVVPKGFLFDPKPYRFPHFFSRKVTGAQKGTKIPQSPGPVDQGHAHPSSTHSLLPLHVEIHSFLGFAQAAKLQSRYRKQARILSEPKKHTKNEPMKSQIKHNKTPAKYSKAS